MGKSRVKTKPALASEPEVKPVLTISTIRITNGMALAVPELNALCARAWAGGYLECEWRSDTAIELARWIESPQCAVFVGLQGGEPKGLLIISLPNSALMPLPLVYTIYNEGPRAVAKAMARAGMDFLQSAGYSSFMGANRLTTDDKLYARLFSHAGIASKMGTLFKFTMPSKE